MLNSTHGLSTQSKARSRDEEYRCSQFIPSSKCALIPNKIKDKAVKIHTLGLQAFSEFSSSHEVATQRHSNHNRVLQDSLVLS
jgi:hypothetical protein